MLKNGRVRDDGREAGVRRVLRNSVARFLHEVVHDFEDTTGSGCSQQEEYQLLLLKEIPMLKEKSMER